MTNSSAVYCWLSGLSEMNRVILALIDLLYSCCFFLNLFLQIKVLSRNGNGTMVQFSKLWGVYFNGVEENNRGNTSHKE